MANTTTLAQLMKDQYALHSAAKNIKEALDEIKDAMLQGKTSCELFLDWTDLPDDWVVLPETLLYLKEKGFTVKEVTDNDTLIPIRSAIISW